MIERNGEQYFTIEEAMERSEKRREEMADKFVAKVQSEQQKAGMNLAKHV